MANEMRRYGRLGWFGWLVGHLFLPPAAYPNGYVWVEGGRVVGNASLMPVQGAPERHVLANVAVDPRFRRRGIARSLVGACLDLARREGGQEVVLQVRADNAGARSLYQEFGFADRGTRVTWRSSAPAIGATSLGHVPARPRRPEEWQAHYALVKRLSPVSLVWPHPLRPAQLRPPSWIGAETWTHWVWPAEGPLQAAVSGRIDPTAGSQFYLLCDLSARGRAERPLLEQSLAAHRHGGPIVVETDAGAGDEAIRRLGFREEHRLTWMTAALADA